MSLAVARSICLALRDQSQDSIMNRNVDSIEQIRRTRYIIIYTYSDHLTKYIDVVVQRCYKHLCRLRWDDPSPDKSHRDSCLYHVMIFTLKRQGGELRVFVLVDRSLLWRQQASPFDKSGHVVRQTAKSTASGEEPRYRAHHQTASGRVTHEY